MGDMRERGKQTGVWGRGGRGVTGEGVKKG